MMQLKRRESSLKQLHTDNQSLQDQLAQVSNEVYTCTCKWWCVGGGHSVSDVCWQVAVMETARAALQNEFDQLLVELETSQSTVEGLEAKLQEEEDRRERELARCANIIRELQQQLATAEEHWSSSREEVNMTS